MYNMNSPTLQAMLQNTPQGVGNMPMYSGSTPTITTSQQQINTPYPSPKDMVIQSGQQAIYAPVGFGNPYPQNIVGGYNPNFQHPAFNGYSNPYMGYGTYGGGYYYPQQYVTEEMRITAEVAEMNGLTYNEQIQLQIKMNQRLSAFVNKSLGTSEEEIEERRDSWDPNIIRSKIQQKNEVIVKKRESKPMHVLIKCNDEVVADIAPDDTDSKDRVLLNSETITRAEQIEMNEKIRRKQIYQQMYNSAPERLADNMDIGELFTGGLSYVMSVKEMQNIRMQRLINSANVYNREKFKERLFNNNNMKTRKQKNAIDRYVGRYGVMPNGRPVTPGLDPSVAQSFSYNTSTGQYEVKPPKFISNMLETARQSFIATLNE